MLGDTYKTVEDLRDRVALGSVLTCADDSGWFVRKKDKYTNGVVLFDQDWYELDEALEVFGPFMVIWDAA